MRSVCRQSKREWELNNDGSLRRDLPLVRFETMTTLCAELFRLMVTFSYLFAGKVSCSAAFSALPGIWLAPFFQQKVYEWPYFSGFLCERPHFSDILVYAHFFRSEIFRACLSSWYHTWIDCDICLTTSKNEYKKIKGQYMNRSTFWMIKYMNGSVFSKARYMNGVGFEILARTPVPKLPLSYPPPSPQKRGMNISVTNYANKYENPNFVAEKISCSTELNMKKKFYDLGAWNQLWIQTTDKNSQTSLWAATWVNVPTYMCAQRKLKSACASRSLTRVCVVRRKKHCSLGYPMYAQTARMHRLIWIFSGHKYPKVRFLTLRLFSLLLELSFLSHLCM